MFLVTVIVTNIAAKRQTLSNDIFAASGTAQTYNCVLKRLDFQQEQGFMSSLALGVNQIEIERGLTTSSTAIFVPFTTCELFQEGEALYYGLNALSNNLIMANRKTLKNPKGLYHKGTGDTRKTRAEAPFAAQMDEQRQKGKILQEDFGNSSVLHPVFLLFVRGHFGKTQMPDCPLRKQERSFAKFYTNHLQISMREGAAA